MARRYRVSRDAPAQLLDQAHHHRDAETRLARRFDAGLEVIGQRLGQAGAVVFDFQPQMSRLRCAAQRHLAALHRGLDGVQQQVQQHLADLVAGDGHRRIEAAVHQQLDTRSARLRRDQALDVVQVLRAENIHVARRPVSGQGGVGHLLERPHAALHEVQCLGACLRLLAELAQRVD